MTSGVDYAALTVLLVFIALVVVMVVTAEIRDTYIAHKRRRAALLARCDQQHRWILAGDERGVYGDYHRIDTNKTGVLDDAESVVALRQS